jgi:teichuronic acid biosynthesis glycosyltransferase TuaC
MKVAVITQYFPDSTQIWGGHSAYQTLRLLSRLCELHVFCPDITYPPGLTPRSMRHPPLDRSWQPEGVSVSYIPYPTIPYFGRPLNGFSIAAFVLPHVRRYRPDIILDYVVHPDGLAALRVARALKVPVVLTAIGSDLNRIPDPICKYLTSYTLRHADRITTVSRDLANTAISLGADPARTIPILNGCDTGVFHPGDPDSEARAEARACLGIEPATEAVVYVGRLDIRKGLVELVAAVAQLRATRPNLHCYLVGDGPDRPIVIEAIARHNATVCITMVAPGPTSVVAQWMSASDLVTLPSYREGCPNVVIEALAAGRPVVATNVGGIPELMDSTCGRLVPPQDVAALARGLDETLSEAAAGKLSAAAISSRHGRSWSDVARDLHHVLTDTLGFTVEPGLEASRPDSRKSAHEPG